MKIILPMLMLLVLCGASFAQKPEPMSIKVFFHPDRLDPDWDDCKKVAPVTRTIPKTSAVATRVSHAYVFPSDLPTFAPLTWG